MIYNSVQNIDSIEGMSSLPDDSVDLIIADPPYNLKKNFGDKSEIWGDKEKWLQWTKDWIDISIQKLKPNGSIFIYGIHHFMCYVQVLSLRPKLKIPQAIYLVL
jgi:DNA modification methylase